MRARSYASAPLSYSFQSRPSEKKGHIPLNCFGAKVNNSNLDIDYLDFLRVLKLENLFPDGIEHGEEDEIEKN